MAALAAIPAIFSSLASAASAIAPIAGLAAAGATAYGTIAAGKASAEAGMMEQQRMEREGLAAKQAADFEARQLEAQGKEEQAAAQREAFALRRQKQVALSRLQSVGAGSGFMATDPSSLAIADEIEKYGTVQEQMAMYGGTSRRDSLDNSAAARRFSGESALQSGRMSGEVARFVGESKRGGSYLSAAGTILGGVSSFADRYATRRPTYATAGRYG